MVRAPHGRYHPRTLPGTEPSEGTTSAFRGARPRTLRVPVVVGAPVPLRRRLKDLRRAILYQAVFRPLIAVLLRVPRVLMRAFLGTVVVPAFHLITRRKSFRHLDKVYGPTRATTWKRRTAYRVTRNFVTGMGEAIEALRRGPDRIDVNLDDRDARALVARLEAGSARGFIALTGHVGNWELLGSWFARTSTRGAGAAIAKRNPNPHLNARFEQFRRQLGLETLYREDPPTAPIRVLRSGRSLAVVPDQDVKNLAGIFVEFLGHSAYTPLGPARIALAADVPIVCGFLLRRDDGSRWIAVSEPIVPDRSAPRAEEIERLTRAWSAEVESIIRAYPDQWAWFHERWRTTPERLARLGRRELEL